MSKKQYKSTMPTFKPNTSSFRMQSPLKTKLGRWLIGRKKIKSSDGTELIVDKEGKLVKEITTEGKVTKFPKGNRPVVMDLRPKK